MNHRRAGFTLIELVVVLGIIAILAMIAVPGLQDRQVREQVVEAMKIAEIAKAPVAAAWRLAHTLPTDNAEAGLPSSDKIVSNLVSSLSVESGAIQVTFGNRASVAINGKTLTLRPAVVEDAPVVPVAWVCGRATAPNQMTVRGLDKTSVAPNFLPLNCRATP